MAATICKGLGQCGCLPVGRGSVGGGRSFEDNVRNARIQGALAAAFTALAILTVVVGALGFSGHLQGVGALFAKNALWVTVAGGLALALALIATVGHQCYKHTQAKVETSGAALAASLFSGSRTDG